MSKVFRSVASFSIRLAKQILKGLLSTEQRIRLQRYLRDSLVGVEGNAAQLTLRVANSPAMSLERDRAHLAIARPNVDSPSVSELREEISRISNAILPNLQKPFVMLEDGVALESVIRTAFQVPSPQHFMLGGVEIPLPEVNSSEGVVRKYIDDRCPRISAQLRDKLSDLLINLLSNPDARQNSEALLKFSPGEGINKYQFEWYMAHMCNACVEEQNKVQQWIELSLEDDSQYMCSLFLAFNFDTVIVSRLSYLLNGYRYSQIGLPSPFVYMMV